MRSVSCCVFVLLLTIAAVIECFHVPGLRLSSFGSSHSMIDSKKHAFLTLKNHGAVRRFPKLFNAPSSDLSGSEPKSYAFESNVARVMDIIINSLYSNKDVFIRELVSNAADACDKRRYQDLRKGIVDENLKIKIYANKENNTLTIEDMGIGMNHEELVQNLGKIAESGTKKFADAIGKSDKDSVNLIGQFGVGFYSGFLVANKVEVVTKGSKGEQLRWEANLDSLDHYSISKDSSNDIEKSGTKIILHLKDDCDQYVDDVTIKALIEKYSEFVQFPIELLVTVTRPESVPDTNEPKGEDGSQPMKTVMNKFQEFQVINSKKPLWLRSPKEISDQEYSDFYQKTFKASDKPLNHAHFSVEGNADFQALLFLPSEVPYELTRDMFDETAANMKLYVKRVFINDRFQDLLPRYLLFIKGIVDSQDLPLNVGREILQQSRTLRIIRQRLIKKSIDMMSELSQRNETLFDGFYKQFGRYLLVGILEDEKYRDEIVALCRFRSTGHSSSPNTTTQSVNVDINDTPDQAAVAAVAAAAAAAAPDVVVPGVAVAAPSSARSSEFLSLPQYVQRINPNQKYIYYTVGDSLAQVKSNPALERYKRLDFEVLLLTDPLEEIALQNIEKFQGYELRDIARDRDAGKSIQEEANKNLSEEERADKAKKTEESNNLCSWIKFVLGDFIGKVEASTSSLETDFPARICQSDYGLSPNIQKFLRAQQHQQKLQQEQQHKQQNSLQDSSLNEEISDVMDQQNPTAFINLFRQATLEINANHPLIIRLNEMRTKDPESKSAIALISLLFQTAAVASGYVLDNNIEYARLVIESLNDGLK